MRTNTWLGIQVLQSELNSQALRIQINKVAKAQAQRDAERDAKFDRAAAVAQSGQFAMWIQTPEGQVFDRWARHAVEASRELEDRQAAWEHLWWRLKTNHYRAANFTRQENFQQQFRHWHHELDAQQVRVVSSMLDNFLNSASQEFPRPENLLPLSGIFFTQRVGDFSGEGDLPPMARDLLGRFSIEDERRIDLLRSDGF